MLTWPPPDAVEIEPDEDENPPLVGGVVVAVVVAVGIGVPVAVEEPVVVDPVEPSSAVVTDPASAAVPALVAPVYVLAASRPKPPTAATPMTAVATVIELRRASARRRSRGVRGVIGFMAGVSPDRPFHSVTAREPEMA